MKNQTLKGGHFLLNEDAGSFSLENGIVPMGNGIILDGMVMGKITATGEFAPHTLAASDGTEVPYGIAFITDNVDTTDQKTAIAIVARAREVSGKELVYFTGTTAAEIKTINQALEDNRNIIVRS